MSQRSSHSGEQGRVAAKGGVIQVESLGELDKDSEGKTISEPGDEVEPDEVSLHTIRRFYRAHLACNIMSARTRHPNIPIPV